MQRYYFLLSVFAPYLVHSQCYFPGGDLAINDRPCNSHAYTTLCCPQGWTCFSNNICIVTDPDTADGSYPIGSIRRGTCTNPRWNDTACGDFCLNDPVSDNNGDLSPCGDDRFCCSPDVTSGLCSCAEEDDGFKLVSGSAITVIGALGLEYTSTSEIPISGGRSYAPTTLVTSAFLPEPSLIGPFTINTTPTLISLEVTNTQSQTVTAWPTSLSMSQATSNPTSSGSNRVLTKSTTTGTPSPSGTGVACLSSQTTIQDASSCIANKTQSTRSVKDKTALRAGIGASSPVIAIVIFALLFWLYIKHTERNDGPELSERSFPLSKRRWGRRSGQSASSTTRVPSLYSGTTPARSVASYRTRSPAAGPHPSIPRTSRAPQTPRTPRHMRPPSYVSMISRDNSVSHSHRQQQARSPQSNRLVGTSSEPRFSVPLRDIPGRRYETPEDVWRVVRE